MYINLCLKIAMTTFGRSIAKDCVLSQDRIRETNGQSGHGVSSSPSTTFSSCAH